MRGARENQCIFLKYYKARLRGFWRWKQIDIRAQAEPRDDHGAPDDEADHAVPVGSPPSPSLVEIESVPERSYVRDIRSSVVLCFDSRSYIQVRDPVDDVLDYILLVRCRTSFRRIFHPHPSSRNQTLRSRSPMMATSTNYVRRWSVNPDTVVDPTPYAYWQGVDLPSDFLSLLQKASPDIEVNENGRTCHSVLRYV